MFKLSPSSLSFLWDGCRHCFYMNVVHGIAQPSIPIPSIFTKIAALLKQYSEAMDTQLLTVEQEAAVPDRIGET